MAATYLPFSHRLFSLCFSSFFFVFNSPIHTGDGKFHFAENVPVRNIGWPLFTAFTPSFERLYGVEIGELSFWEAVSSSSSASMKSVDVMARGSRILITDMSFRVISRSGHCLPPGLPIVLTLPQEWLLEDYVPIVAPAAAVITTKHKLPVEEGEEGPPLKRPKAIVNQELDPRLKRKPPPPPPSVASFKEEEDDVPKPKSKPIIIQTKTRTNENDSAAVGLLLADLVRLSNAPKMSSPPIISDDVLPPFCSPPPQENKDVERKKEAEQQSDESKVVVVVKEEEAERKEVVSLEEVICLDDYKPVGKGKGKRRKKMVVMGPRTRTRRYGQDGLLDFMFRKLSFPTHFFPLFS